jgi:flagellar hook-basal body complex protein FliE
MSIQPIGAVSGLVPDIGVQSAAGLGAPTATAGVTRTTAAPGQFGIDLAGAVENLQALQSRASALGIRAVTGDLDDIHDYTIASSQAAVTLELTAAIRNKAVEAFTEIMRMQA